MVHDPVDDRGRELVVREDRAPFAEPDVRGGRDAPPPVAARDDPVEQARPVDVERHVAELVQDDQVGSADVPGHRVEVPVAFGLAELEHELRALVEPHVQVCFVKRWRAVLPWLVVRVTGQLSAGLPCRLVSSGFACFVIA